jgi:hypothetical protein
MNEAAEHILQGPEYFDCERLRARMSVSCCIARQKKAQYLKPFYVHPGNQPLGHCNDCPQGRENMKEGNTMKKGICKNCDRSNMAIIGRGLCPACYRYKDDPTGLKAAKERLCGKKSRKALITAVGAKIESREKDTATQPNAPPAPAPTGARKLNGSFQELAELLEKLNAIPGIKTTLTLTIG